jgi:hypothetical protein
MVAGLIVTWLALLVVGFALVVLPWLGDPAMFTADEAIDPTVLNALYYSGVTVATLGYGDIRPIAPVFRGMAVVQALSGAVTVSAAVTYILAVYPALARQRQVAIELDAEVAGRAGGLPLVRRYLGEGASWDGELMDRLRGLALDLLDITESHESHPVLYYAHPRRVQHSFLRVLATAQGLVGALRYGLSPEGHPSLVRHPHLLLLEQALHYTLRRLSASLHIVEVPEIDVGAAEREVLAARYGELCAELEGLGLTSSRQLARRAAPVLVDAAIERAAGDHQPALALSGAAVPDDTGAASDPALDLESSSAEDAYVVFRLETDRYLEAYAAACGYPIELARADFPAAWWTGGRREGR